MDEGGSGGAGAGAGGCWSCGSHMVVYCGALNDSTVVEDAGEACVNEYAGSAEGPLDRLPDDKLSGFEHLPARALCDWNEVVVLAGLEIDGGLVTSCEDVGVAWLEGD